MKLPTLFCAVCLLASTLTAQRAPLNTLNVSSSGTNFIADLNTSEFIVTATNNIHLLHSTNRSATTTKYSAYVLVAGTTNRLLTFNSNWRWLGTTNNPPTSLASNKVAILALKSYGSSETNVLAAYAVQP